MQAHYTQGSIYKHILLMALMSAVGLLSIFIVDLVDLYFLSLLGEVHMASAIGFAGIILFFTIAISIGLMITMGALVAKSIGAKNKKAAKQYTINIYIVCLIIGIIIGFISWFYCRDILTAMGATGRSLTLATSYLRIILPSLPILCIGMASAGVLRSVGDAKHGMFTTLIAGIVNAILDPIFIFYFDMGIAGAAWASVIARLAMMLYALYFVLSKHHMLGSFSPQSFKADLPAISQVALPAILTNIATPIGNAYIIYVLANFGDDAVAAFAIIGRLVPVVFCLVFAISGAVGPIIGQNHGAKKYQRVKETIQKSLIIIIAYCLLISLILYLLQQQIVQLFNATGETQRLLELFCTWVAVLTIFRGFLFVANASFNNLDKAQYSTIMNFGKATIGTVPFVYFGAKYYGAFGILLFEAIGSIVFGLLATVMSFRLVKKLNA